MCVLFDLCVLHLTMSRFVRHALVLQTPMVHSYLDCVSVPTVQLCAVRAGIKAGSVLLLQAMCRVFGRPFYFLVCDWSVYST